MKAGFELEHGRLVASNDPEATVLVYVSPDEDERRQVVKSEEMDAFDIDSALDPDEVSRAELTSDRLSLIWKRPNSTSCDEELQLDVSSLGLFLRQDRLLVILNDGPIPFSAREFQGVESAPDVLLRFLLHTVRQYLSHLKVIKQLSRDLESKVSASMENRYLLQMFALSESLVYCLNAIEANGAALVKLRGLADRIGLLRQHTEALDDLILENQQCARQARIYTDVLAGLMDARGTIVNNNMNVLLKNLTLINIIFLPLNLIASIGGMSEYSMMTRGIHWLVSYAALSLGMVVLGWATWWILVRALDGDARRKRAGV
ncbi:MAG: magnesium transporter CorA family protein [Armatimonadetes bacterium]|nr:magnesium transporter CorA family protein [Armatimonadota bacterium]